MSNEIQEVKAIVFKQFNLKWQEVGKSAVVAGITAALTVLGTSIYAGRMPTMDELKAAAMIGATTMLGALIRYFSNPTTTVIKGQTDPIIKITPPDKVTTTDASVS